MSPSFENQLAWHPAVVLYVVRFHAGTLREGMRAAIDEVRRNYAAIVGGWRR